MDFYSNNGDQNVYMPQGSPEQATLNNINLQIRNARMELQNIEMQKAQALQTLNAINNQILSLRKTLIETEETALLQSFGMYTPHYAYSTSDEYKNRLRQIRQSQKDMIKNGTAVHGNMNWTVNGSNSQGQKMVKDMQKLLLRAFNAECDDAVEHVKFNNVEAYQKKITASAEAISKLGTVMQIYIAVPYYQLKIQELYLMHEYQLKKQQEKEEAKEQRARQREEAIVAKELEEARRKLEKEQSHYLNALKTITEQISKTENEEERLELEKKKAEHEEHLAKLDAEFKEVDYRESNQRAGYVYVISNIGAFGENVYKIGMTRRLDPMERIDELGDASVPFNFDVHAMIFTEDAPGLESALHNAFADRKVNCINQRREFFNVTLDEVKEVIRKNYDKTVEFVDVAPAEQYRESLLIRSGRA